MATALVTLASSLSFVPPSSVVVERFSAPMIQTLAPQAPSIAPALVANAPAATLSAHAESAVILGGFSFFVQGFLFLYALVITLVTLTDIESRNSAFHRIFGGVRRSMSPEARAAMVAKAMAVQDAAWNGAWDEVAAYCEGDNGCMIVRARSCVPYFARVFC